MPRTKRLHFKDLDALRFFAFIPIFLFCVFYLSRTEREGFHFEITNVLSLIKQNSLDFFFFLSAFLLTSQALREYKYNDSFSLRSFYVRRMLRILPLFIVGILFAFLVHPWILSTLKLNTITAPAATSYLLLFPNYFSNFTQEQYVYLTVIWTIYMFIQFYIVWGIVLKYLWKQLRVVAFVAIGIGITARIIHLYHEHIFEFDTLSYGVPVGIGTILAILIRNDSPYLEQVKLLPKKTIIFIYVTGCLILATGYLLTANFIFNALVPIITCLFYSFIVVEQTFGKNSLVKFRNNKVFSHLGKASYGMIMYQAMLSVSILIGIDSLDFDISEVAVKFTFVLITFVLTWIMADLSFNFFEKPLLRFRREFKKI